jgi:MFS family permease
MTRVKAFTNDTFRSLRVRNFRLFFGGQLISQVGNWLTLVAQSLLVYRITDSGVALGILAAAQFGPILLLGPWGGLIADRSDKRKLLMIVQSVAMLQSFALAALAFMGNPPLIAFYAVAFVGGVTMAFDNPARRAYVVEMVPEDHVNNAVSLNSTLMTFSRIIGPAVAGLLIATVGFGWCFLLDGISYIAVIGALWMMRPEELRRAPAAVRGKGQVREGLRYARSVPELWVPLVMMALVGTLAYNFQVVYPIFATRDLGGTDATFTLLFSVVSVGALVGALGSARREKISVRSVAFAALAFGVAIALMAIAPGVPVALLFALLVGFTSIGFLTTSTSIVQMEAAPEMRGRVLALQAMVFLGSTPIGGPIVGWLSQQYGARFGVAIGALACFVAGAWGLMVVRRSEARSLTAEETERAVAEALDDFDHTETIHTARA